MQEVSQSHISGMNVTAFMTRLWFCGILFYFLTQIPIFVT